MSLDDRNAVLDKKLQNNAIDDAVAALIKADQRRKGQILLLFISIAFDLILSVFLAFGWQANHQLALRAESNHDAIVRSCETSNEARAKNKELWNYILSLPPSNDGNASTPDQQKRVNDFKAFLDDTFKIRDCKNI